MDALKAEIQRKRKIIEKVEAVSKDEGDAPRKYYKRADLEAMRKDDYAKRHSIGTAKPDLDRDTDSPSGSGSQKYKDLDVSAKQADHHEEVKLPRKEVVRRLRERNEPIRLYGETDEESLRRLKILEVQEPELDDGLRNDFKAAMDKIDMEYMNDMAKGQTSPGKSNVDIKIQDDGTTMEDIRRLINLQSETSKREAVSRFMRFIMKCWAEDLNKRPMEEKISPRGKIDRGTYGQTEDYLKTLFQKLRNKSLPDDILHNLIRIILQLLEGDYVKANEVFLQMAIGNAPWPIGVTAVGIHSRPGREKVFTQMIAHVLNDETQRKYIQGFKRLMTKMQNLFPADPSRCVEYHAITKPGGPEF